MLRVFENPQEAEAAGWRAPDEEQGLACFDGTEWVFVTDVFVERIAEMVSEVLASTFRIEVDMVLVLDNDNDFNALWISSDTTSGIASCISGITAGIMTMLARIHPLGGARHASGELWEELIMPEEV